MAHSSDGQSRPVLRDLLIVASPIALFAIAGYVVTENPWARGAIINLGYVGAAAVATMVLRREGSGWHDIGLGRPVSWPKTIMWGVMAWVPAIAIFLAIQWVAGGVMALFGIAAPAVDQSRFEQIVGNLPLLLLMLSLSWTVIAFGEEMFYRAFLVSRLVGRAGMRPVAAIWLAGGLFGLAHFGEGPVGILSNGGFGVFMAWIYVRSRGNLWICIITHGLMNTLRFTLLYAGAV